MPKAPQAPKSKKIPRKRPEAPVSRAAGVTRAKQDAVGHVADKITRAPKKKRQSPSPSV